MTPTALRLRAALLTIAVASTAHATKWGVSPFREDFDGVWILGGGYGSYGVSSGTDAFGYGGELSVVSWFGRQPFAGVWSQLGRVEGPLPYVRGAAGAEVFFGLLGVEVGATKLWFDDSRRAYQLAVSPFVTMGVASLSLRMGIPLDATARSLGFDGSLVATFKFIPIPIGDVRANVGFGHGRPFSCGSSSLAARADWA